MYDVGMTRTTPTFDPAAARRRRFDAGMAAHDDVDAIIVTRRRWVANCDRPDQFCSVCTGYKGAAASVCRSCATGA